MCGRYALKMLDGFLRDHPWIVGPCAIPDGAGDGRYNIAPTQPIAAVVGGDGAAHVEFLRWGLVPSWATDLAVGNKMINARAETVAEKPAFRRLVGSRRCLVVADGFYEWKTQGRVKTPYFVRMRSGEPFALAGLWDEWRDRASGERVRTCTILTGEPNGLVGQFHTRMAVIVRPDRYRWWVDAPVMSAEEMATVAIPYPAEALEAYPVSSAVNSARAQGVELTWRAEPEVASQGMLF